MDGGNATTRASASTERPMKYVTLGQHTRIDEDTRIGYNASSSEEETRIGDRARIRSGSTIYGDVRIGDDFRTGHDVIIREGTRIGDETLLGTGTVLDGKCSVGSNVSLQTRCYVPPYSTIHDEVFMGPHAVLTNDEYPVRREEELEGPTLHRGVSIGANATILPGIEIGEGSFVAAGAVVTETVPPHTLAVGVPARNRPLPKPLQGRNQLV